MSILTTQVADNDYLHELVNDHGFVIAQLSDERFEELRRNGVTERIVNRKKS